MLGASATKVAGVVRYRVLVTNSGRAEVTAPGAAVRRRRRDRHGERHAAAAASAREIDFRGPTCTDAVTAAADPDGTIVESSESDNVDEVPCPTDGSARRPRSGKRLSRRYDEDGERPPVH